MYHTARCGSGKIKNRSKPHRSKSPALLLQALLTGSRTVQFSAGLYSCKSYICIIRCGETAELHRTALHRAVKSLSIVSPLRLPDFRQNSGKLASLVRRLLMNNQPGSSANPQCVHTLLSGGTAGFAYAASYSTPPAPFQPWTFYCPYLATFSR